MTKRSKAPSKIEYQKIEKSEIHHAKVKPKHQIIWDAPEFHYYPKNHFWIFGMMVLFAAMIMLLYALRDWLYLGTLDYLLVSVIVVLIVYLLQRYGHAKPSKFKVELGERGITFRHQFYAYTSLKSFWLVEEPKTVLYLDPAIWVWLPISIILDKEDLEEVRAFLTRYLPEHPTASELFVDRLGRLMRF